MNMKANTDAGRLAQTESKTSWSEFHTCQRNICTWYKKKLFLSEDALFGVIRWKQRERKWNVCTNRVINYDIVCSGIKFRLKSEGTIHKAHSYDLICESSLKTSPTWLMAKLKRGTQIQTTNLWAVKRNLHKSTLGALATIKHIYLWLSM